MGSMISVSSQWDLPVAPGPPRNSVSPVKTRPRSRARMQPAPGGDPAWAHLEQCAGHVDRHTVREIDIPEVIRVGELPQHPVVGEA
jgi:hypothetical protein